jgi:nucleoside-diphosphate-sugar epimerase
MTVLFTGHRGFLGREIIPLIKDDCDVVTWEGDYTERKRTQELVKDLKVKQIIHAAARGGRRTKSDSLETLSNNLISSLNLLDCQLPTIVFCSGAIYDRRATVNIAKETTSLDSYPSDYYGQSKFLINKIVREQDWAISLRFFNVFGKSEGLDRFISFNVFQYIKKQPMVVYKDFQMDFFYVADVAPVIRKWLHGAKLPTELNLVYDQKYLLSEICKFINQLDSHTVPINHLEPASTVNYTGDGDLLKSLNLPLLGLTSGIRDIYNHFKSL